MSGCSRKLKRAMGIVRHVKVMINQSHQRRLLLPCRVSQSGGNDSLYGSQLKLRSVFKKLWPNWTRLLTASPCDESCLFGELKVKFRDGLSKGNVKTAQTCQIWRVGLTGCSLGWPWFIVKQDGVLLSKAICWTPPPFTSKLTTWSLDSHWCQSGNLFQCITVLLE